MRILIDKMSSMGDVVHALPLAADIARAKPGAHIGWLIEEGFADIAALSPHVNQVHTAAWRRWRKSMLSSKTRAEMCAVEGELREASYDLVLDCQGLVKSAWLGRWARAPIAGFSLLSAREPLASLFYSRRFAISQQLHATVRCRRLGAEALGYALDGPPMTDLVARAPQAVQMDRPYAVLLTNASRASKWWPQESWIAVEAWLAARDLSSLLFWGSDAEAASTQALAARMQRAVVAPRAGLNSIASSLAGADMVVGLDTGLTHLASALGRPTVGIFRDHDPRLVGGVNPWTTNLGGVAGNPGVDEVVRACEQLLRALH